MLLPLVCVLLAICSVRGQAAQSEIAFSVGLSVDMACNGGERVLYNRIYTNIGAAYSTNTGKFVCPQSGMYVFQVHALSANDSDMWLELRHNYHYVVSIWGHTDKDYSAGGNTAILQLNKGDEVSVVCTDQYHSELYGASDEVYGTFSGYLISSIYQEIPVVG